MVGVTTEISDLKIIRSIHPFSEPLSSQLKKKKNRY